MDYKRKSDEIRLASILVRDKRTSYNLRAKKLNEIADLSEMYNYGDTLKHEFVKNSLNMQKLNQQVKWNRYYKELLIEMERYELLHFLKLD